MCFCSQEAWSWEQTQLPVQFTCEDTVPKYSVTECVWAPLSNGIVPPPGAWERSSLADGILQTVKYCESRNIERSFTALILILPVLLKPALSKVTRDLTVAQSSNVFYLFWRLCRGWHRGPTFSFQPSASLTSVKLSSLNSSVSTRVWLSLTSPLTVLCNALHGAEEESP